jgi:hypothetical protein
MKLVMKATIGSFSVLLLTFSLAACAADVSGLDSNTHVPQQPCAGNGNSRNCWIDVNVAETEAGSACRIWIPDEQHDVQFLRQDGVRIITWRIAQAPDAYRFRSDGIYIKEGPVDREWDLDLFTWAEQGKQYRVRNRNRSEGAYRYGVGIVNRDNGVRCDLDPYVRNVR